MATNSTRHQFSTPTSPQARRATAFLLGSIIAPLAGGAANAQTPDLPEISVYANQAPTDVSKVGVATTILRGDDLRAQGYTDVATALRTVAGVEISQSGTRGGLTQASIRGSQAKHVLVLVDGVPVNDLQDGFFDFADFSLEGIGRIEVIRGPQSGIHGANANAGVIAITTISGRGRKPGATLRLEGGTQDTGTVAGTAHGSAGPFYGAVSFDRSTTAGYSISRFGDNKNGAYRTNLGGTVGVDFTPDFNVEGSFRAVNRTASVDIQPGAFVIPSDPFGTDFNAFKSLQGRINGRWKSFDGVFVQNFGASRYGDHLRAFDSLSGAFQTDGNRDSLNYKGTVYVPHSFFGEHQSITFAADWQRESLVLQSAFFDPASAAFWASKPTRIRVGYAGEYTIDLPTQTTLTTAVRHESDTGFVDNTTWRFTLSQRLFDNTRLHASSGTGVTNPSFIDQFGFFPSAFIGNPNLRPESSFGWDAGWEQTWLGGRVITDVTYFNVQFDNKITTIFDPTFHSTIINVPGVSPRQGLEVSVKVNPVDWATISATYTYTEARLADGTPEVRQPMNKGSLNATTHWLDNTLHVSTGVVFNGSMPDTVFTFPSTLAVLPAYTVVNASVNYDIAPNAQIYLRAENAFNQRYEEVFSFLAPPRSVYAGLRLRLDD